VFLASEPMTGEAWLEIADATLLRVERTPAIRLTTLTIDGVRSDGSSASLW